MLLSWRLKFPDEKTSPKAPINPKMTPIIFIHRKPSLKNKRPITTVKRGTSEFNIPVKELLICVWANGNRYAGMPLPKSPAMHNLHHWCFFIFRKFLNRIGDKNIAEIRILSEATCDQLKERSPFFIKMNELPQINAKHISRVH